LRQSDSWFEGSHYLENANIKRTPLPLALYSF
jgi:hypothetical protein